MPDMNMQTFEELKRHQLVTEFDIQSQSELEDYQVKLDDVDNPTQAQDNLIVGVDGESLPHWNESFDFDTWIKMNIATSGKRGLLIHGNAGLSSGSSGDDTFVQYHSASTTDYLGTLNIPYTNVIYETQFKQNTHRVFFGLSNNADALVDDSIFIYEVSPTIIYLQAREEGSDTVIQDSTTVDANYHRYKIELLSGTAHGYKDGTEILTGLSSGLPNENMGLVFDKNIGGGIQDWAFARKYTATEPDYILSTPKNISTALKSFGRAG